MRPLLALLALFAVGSVSSPTGKTELVAGEGLNEPFGVDFDRAGNVYVVEMGGNRVSVWTTRTDATASSRAPARRASPATAARRPRHVSTDRTTS